MNIYLIQDQDSCDCWMAETMAEAIKAAENAYILTLGDGMTSEDDAKEREWFQDQVESCNLVGPLGNPPNESKDERTR